MQGTKHIVECAMQYIRENYHNTNLSEEMVSCFVGVTPISFSNLFKRVTGQTYVSYLRTVRMDAAKKMLSESNEKTYIIARKVGIEDPNYFSFLFKKQYGISPSQYREEKKSEHLYEQEKSEKEILVHRAKQYIDRHYQNSELSAERISGELNISRIYFSSLFRKVTGRTYVSYLREIRMTAAAQLLSDTKEKACEVAERVGFEDSNYFSFAFKKYYGISPSQYRENDYSRGLAG